MKYESKQQQIHKNAEQIYDILSKFSNFTPILKNKVEQWQSDEDSCSFVVKGFKVALKMDEKVPGKLIKIVQQEGGATPVSFVAWIQLKEMEPDDTRIRIVMEVELNTMMKMMIGGKMQKAVDTMAEQIATALN